MKVYQRFNRYGRCREDQSEVTSEGNGAQESDRFVQQSGRRLRIVFGEATTSFFDFTPVGTSTGASQDC